MDSKVSFKQINTLTASNHPGNGSRKVPLGVLFHIHTVTQQTLKDATAPALVAFSFF